MKSNIQYDFAKYSSDFDSLFPIVSKLLKIEHSIWNGNLYLHLDSNFNPVITGWIQIDKDMENETIRLAYKKGKWYKIV